MVQFYKVILFISILLSSQVFAFIELDFIKAKNGCTGCDLINAELWQHFMFFKKGLLF